MDFKKTIYGASRELVGLKQILSVTHKSNLTKLDESLDFLKRNKKKPVGLLSAAQNLDNVSFKINKVMNDLKGILAENDPKDVLAENKLQMWFKEVRKMY